MEHRYDLAALLNTAERAARAAGGLIKEMVSQPRELSSKGFRDIVTDADVAAQKTITDIIRGAYPDHGFVTEESDSDLPSEGPVVWVIDPIDGTTNYSRQLPEFCVSIGAAVQATGELLVGVVYDPARDEMFSGAKGMGSHLNGAPMRVSQVAEIGESLLGLDWSRSRPLRQAVLDALDATAHQVFTIRAVGAAAVALAWVAAGRLDLYMNYSLSAWDVAAAAVLIREAGGMVTDLDGIEWRLGGHDGSCAASNGINHAEFTGMIPGLN